MHVTRPPTWFLLCNSSNQRKLISIFLNMQAEHTSARNERKLKEFQGRSTAISFRTSSFLSLFSSIHCRWLRLLLSLFIPAIHLHVSNDHRTNYFCHCKIVNYLYIGRNTIYKYFRSNCRIGRKKNVHEWIRHCGVQYFLSKYQSAVNAVNKWQQHQRRQRQQIKTTGNGLSDDDAKEKPKRKKNYQKENEM